MVLARLQEFFNRERKNVKQSDPHRALFDGLDTIVSSYPDPRAARKPSNSRRKPYPKPGKMQTDAGYSLAEAAQICGVDIKTVKRRLQARGIESSIDPQDRRVRRITPDQLRNIR